LDAGKSFGILNADGDSRGGISGLERFLQEMLLILRSSRVQHERNRTAIRWNERELYRQEKGAAPSRGDFTAALLDIHVTEIERAICLAPGYDLLEGAVAASRVNTIEPFIRQFESSRALKAALGEVMLGKLAPALRRTITDEFLEDEYNLSLFSF
jgi:hypothetical protein